MNLNRLSWWGMDDFNTGRDESTVFSKWLGAPITERISSAQGDSVEGFADWPQGGSVCHPIAGYAREGITYTQREVAFALGEVAPRGRSRLRMAARDKIAA